MRRIFAIITALFGALIIASVFGAVLVVTGNPAACVDRDVPVSPAESAALETAWNAFKAQAQRGEATITVTESQVTSRGVQYVAEKDVPVENLQVYFCPDGTAEASGEISALGVTANVVVRGTLDLGGAKPRIKIDEIKAGNLPSSIATSLVNFVLNRSDFRTLDIGPKLLSIGYADGSSTVKGGP